MTRRKQQATIFRNRYRRSGPCLNVIVFLFFLLYEDFDDRKCTYLVKNKDDCFRNTPKLGPKNVSKLIKSTIPSKANAKMKVN